MTDSEVDYLIELRGVYDGWSVAVHKDGTLRNRWADEHGNPRPGDEQRWRRTEEAIGRMRPAIALDEHADD